MDIHNTSEDIVFKTVQTIFNQIDKGDNPEGFCLCDQCRLDTICYVLNRFEPHYIVSNRGLSRMEQDHIRRQQYDADAATLIYAGLRQVNHNLRPTASHEERNAQDNVDLSRPAFDMPTIVGRVLNGSTFEPIVDINVELRCNQELAPMRNTNWQNPYTISPITPGTFSFWPAPLPCEAPDMHNIFQYSIKIDHPDYEPLTHFFNIAVVSKFSTPFYHLSNMDRTYKLPDLYIFPPGEAELNG